MTQNRHSQRIRDERLGVSAFCDEANRLFQQLLEQKRMYFAQEPDSAALLVTVSVNRFADYFANRFAPVQCVAEVLGATMARKQAVLDESAREFREGIGHFRALKESFEAVRGMGGLNEGQSQAVIRMERLAESLETQVEAFVAQRSGRTQAVAR